MDGGFGQCILCGDCIDICQIRMAPEGLPAPLRWNTEPGIIPLEAIGEAVGGAAGGQSNGGEGRVPAEPVRPIQIMAAEAAQEPAATATEPKASARRPRKAPLGFAEPPPELLARAEAPRPRRQMLLGCALIPVLLTAGMAALALRVRAAAQDRVVVPAGEVVLVRAEARDDAALVGRIGEGRELPLVGRSADWRWLSVTLPKGDTAWTRRPLDLAPWALEAPPLDGVAGDGSPLAETRMDAAVGVDLSPPEAEMIAFPAATFTMGSPEGRGAEDEHPAREVTLSAFAIDVLEVSLGDYWRCVLAGACAAPLDDDIGPQAGYVLDPTFDDHPVVHVPWAEAKHFCGWRGARLPTEAEWERAAGTRSEPDVTSIWPWGDEAQAGAANTAEGGPGRPVPVGTWTRDRSATGVADLGGNVREWVLDAYKHDYYTLGDTSDPKGPSMRRNEGRGRVVRGGSYASDADAARVSHRGSADPAYGRPDIGFRCARDGGGGE